MTKKHSKSALALDLIEQKRKIEERISHVTIRISSLPPIGYEAGDCRMRLESFIYQNGGSESNIPKNRLGDYHHLKSQAEEKAAAAKRATEKESRLRSELADLKQELKEIQILVGAQEVITHKKNVEDLGNMVDKLDKAIQQQEETIARVNSGNPRLVELKKKKQKLSADIAMGEEDHKAELQQVESLITDEELKDEELRKTAQDAAQTIIGLKKKLVDATNKFNRAQADHKEIATQFLVTEMHRAGKEYIILADQLSQKFLQIVSLSKICEKRNQHLNVLGTYSNRFKIPAFNLSACKEAALENNTGFLFDFVNTNKAAAEEQERERITGLGVDLS